ncbi:TetR/AcrR family transcriptional regulator [Lysinibacillus sp. NPDC097214]|uniref:TetR/AcrR family transcriptional regulator n=1 Tax=Lysinibacillus sp. NPDC097214 TaxID=3390584 RepID=UPI003D00130E
MKDKKLAIIQSSFDLFLSQGYHATSIQDILNKSNVSKGTFYNYFESKSSLLQQTLLYREERIQYQRDLLLDGDNVGDRHIFIQQIEVTFLNKGTINMSELMDDAAVSDDSNLIKFMKELRNSFIEWLYKRLHQIYGVKYESYIAEMTLVFAGILQNLFHFSPLINNKSNDYSRLIEYSLTSAETIIANKTQGEKAMVTNEAFEQNFEIALQTDSLFSEFAMHTNSLKKAIERLYGDEPQISNLQYDLVAFVQQEIVAEQPNRALILSTITTFNSFDKLHSSNELDDFLQTMQNLGYEIF